MTVDRTAATDAEFAARFAPFDAALAAEESSVERVARAIVEAQDAHRGSGFPCRCGWLAGFGDGWEDRLYEHRLYATAVAAITAMRPAPDAPQADEGDELIQLTQEQIR